MGIQTQLGVEGPSLLSIRGHCSQYYGWGFRAQGTKGGPEASQWEKEGAGKEALECSQLRQPGLRHRAGKQNPRTVRLECAARWAYPWPGPAPWPRCLPQTLAKSLPGALSCFSMDQPCLALPLASSANKRFGYDLLGHGSSRTCSR